ncbi:hypothetical protein L484_018840 [Morus notabilis]|uniref:Uncharacterized protein n=1 Tax=Morus notabilis TaxID=981085 RepID=W9SE48_9ROSA|nr:hypothetical protein L484_018840 [Morus notabilis]
MHLRILLKLYAYHRHPTGYSSFRLTRPPAFNAYFSIRPTSATNHSFSFKDFKRFTTNPEQKECMAALEKISTSNYKYIKPFLQDYIYYTAMSGNTYNNQIGEKMLIKLPVPLRLKYHPLKEQPSLFPDPHSVKECVTNFFVDPKLNSKTVSNKRSFAQVAEQAERTNLQYIESLNTKLERLSVDSKSDSLEKENQELHPVRKRLQPNNQVINHLNSFLEEEIVEKIIQFAEDDIYTVSFKIQQFLEKIAKEQECEKATLPFHSIHDT